MRESNALYEIFNYNKQQIHMVERSKVFVYCTVLYIPENAWNSWEVSTQMQNRMHALKLLVKNN